MKKLMLTGVLVCAGAGGLWGVPFIRGDVNQDGTHDIADAINALTYLFGDGSTTCADALDVNDDGAVDIADPIALLTYLFADGPDPEQPFPECGDDGSPDELSCDLFNTDICTPIPPLRVTGIAPAYGPPEGGTPVVITGESFSAAPVEAFLCNVGLLDVNVASDVRIEAVTPPGEPESVCDLRLSNGADEATLTGAFTYQPACLRQEDLADVIDEYLGQPICMPSPAFEDPDLLGGTVACPEAPENTCSSGEPGCEASIDEIEVTVDIDAGTVGATYSASSNLPVDLGGTPCMAALALDGTAAMDFTLAPTQWEGVFEITDVSNLVFEITALSVDASGGLVCIGLELGAGLLRDALQEQLNGYAGEFLEPIREELVGSYVCP